MVSSSLWFGNAVHALADPVPVWDRGVARWSDPLYDRLRTALSGGRAASSGWRLASSRAPLRFDVLTLLVEIDDMVTCWTPDDKGVTADRLRELAGRGWRPQDCELLDGYASRVEAWTLKAVDLLGDRCASTQSVRSSAYRYFQKPTEPTP